MRAYACSLRLPALQRLSGNWIANAQKRSKSESASIFDGLKSNKVGLSKQLDTVLRNAHDMRIFGVGFVRSCANREEYTHFMASHYHFYSALEEECAKQRTDSAIGKLWHACPELHGATRKLEIDLAEVGRSTTDIPPTPATAAYVSAMRNASKSEDGVLLISHFYTRYLADLFGGSMLGYPTRVALGLNADSPTFYNFPAPVTDRRAEYIEHVYASINKAGADMDEAGHKRLVEEARLSFGHNASIYKERPRFYVGAAVGGIRVATGVIAHRLGAARGKQALSGS